MIIKVDLQLCLGCNCNGVFKDARRFTKQDAATQRASQVLQVDPVSGSGKQQFRVSVDTAMGRSESKLQASFSEIFGYLIRQCIFSVLSAGPVPNHIAFIMDGNRRYAKTHNLLEGDGHKAGFYALLRMLSYCYELGVKYVTFYTFSIDNFKRRPEEVECIMKLIQEKLVELTEGGEESFVNRLGLRIYFRGNLGLLSDSVRSTFEMGMAKTEGNSKLVLSVCVPYTSTDEIVHAVQESCEEKWNEIDENNSFEVEQPIGVTDIDRHMYIADVPDPDIIIRTSGESRLSNFLLWQSAYCLLYLPRVLWPELGLWHLISAIIYFQRNYLYVKEKKKVA